MLIRRGRWTVEERIRKMVWGKGEERNVGRARKEKIETFEMRSYKRSGQIR